MKRIKIRNYVGILLATLFLATSFQLHAQKKYGGLALYTVRNDMETNAKATLLAVAEAGYKNIEAAGYNEGKFYNMSPVAFKKLLKEMGLRPIRYAPGICNLGKRGCDDCRCQSRRI